MDEYNDVHTIPNHTYPSPIHQHPLPAEMKGTHIIDLYHTFTRSAQTLALEQPNPHGTTNYPCVFYRTYPLTSNRDPTKHTAMLCLKQWYTNTVLPHC